LRVPLCGYDPAGRLIDVTKNGASVALYDYDANGNRLSVTRPGTGTVSGTYDAQDRLTTYGAVTYSYSANGDLQTATGGGETTTYSYDVFGNLTAVALPNGTNIEYVIDGQNRRIGKKVNGNLVQGFVYSGRLRIAAELDGTGTVVSRFVYGIRHNVPDYMLKGGATYRIITDPLGSPRLVVDSATGAIAQRMDYDEFGQVTQDTNPGFQPFGFAGGLYDPDTKLVRFGHRDYDGFTGRWTAKDPLRFEGGGTNLFAYVLQDPVNLRDPMGLSALGRLVKAYRASKGGERELIKQVYSRSPQELLNEVKTIADKATEGSAISVLAQSEGKAKAIAKALSPDGKARREKHPGYPWHYNPNKGPYAGKVHTEWALAILAPNTLGMMNDPCTTMGELLSAGLWDIAGAIDPIFLTDAIDWYFGIDR
jgi:RHS repeat-associated protein